MKLLYFSFKGAQSDFECASTSVELDFKKLIFSPPFHLVTWSNNAPFHVATQGGKNGCPCVARAPRNLRASHRSRVAIFDISDCARTFPTSPGPKRTDDESRLCGSGHFRRPARKSSRDDTEVCRESATRNDCGWTRGWVSVGHKN